MARIVQSSLPCQPGQNKVFRHHWLQIVISFKLAINCPNPRYLRTIRRIHNGLVRQCHAIVHTHSFTPSPTPSRSSGSFQSLQIACFVLFNFNKLFDLRARWQCAAQNKCWGASQGCRSAAQGGFEYLLPSAVLSSASL